jgi:PadR family transcriptional regulator PadR
MKGVTDLLILSLLEAERSYGYELVERLVAAGLTDLNEATVYGALRRLETAGLLESTLVASAGGPARRYYRPTDAGLAHRRRLIADWSAFITTVAAVLAPASTSETRQAAS